MTKHPTFRNRVQAIKYIKETIGHSELFNTGWSNDPRYGSRLYFCAPDAPRNPNGVPINDHSTMSLEGRNWKIMDFTQKEEEAA